jgi:hypothetical protein
MSHFWSLRASVWVYGVLIQLALVTLRSNLHALILMQSRCREINVVSWWFRTPRTAFVIEENFVDVYCTDMRHPEFLAVNSLYTTPCHCEVQLRVRLESIPSSSASSPKQSHCFEFAAKSVKRDCFVASLPQNSANTNLAWIISQNAPTQKLNLRTRNGYAMKRSYKLKRKSEFVSNQTQIFGMTHVGWHTLRLTSFSASKHWGVLHPTYYSEYTQ